MNDRTLPSRAALLRIFLGEDDRHDGTPLYEWIVREARTQGLAGATVHRGIEGFGATSRLHTAKILRLSTDLPIIVEIVDTRDKVEALLEAIGPRLGAGMVTVEEVEIRHYSSSQEE